MKATLLLALLLTPLLPSAAPAARRHCQVPCGIYGDQMRIQMLMEDAATIAKGMTSIKQLEASEEREANQLVRWIMNKDEHAANIQDMVASYWLAQRIKAPKSADRAARTVYLKQLESMHGITVAAMKCKQTTDLAHVEALRRQAREFAATYFSKDDLEHIREHQEGK